MLSVFKKHSVGDELLLFLQIKKHLLQKPTKRLMEIHKIEAGTFQCDGGAIFGVVPKRVWQKRYPADRDNFCKMAMRCLYIAVGDKRIIIETGAGDKQLQYLKYYNFQDVLPLDKALLAFGTACEDITDVILTHLHFDHCGGCTHNATDGTIRMRFPNAAHWVGKTQWDNFLNPNIRESDSYFVENMAIVEQSGQLRLIESDRFLCPEIELRIFDGHTVGQLVPYITLPNQTLVYVGDVIPMSANIPLAWISAYDTHPIRSMEEKQRLLDEAIEKAQMLFFGHDAYTECCTVVSTNGKYRIGETFDFDTVITNSVCRYVRKDERKRKR
ncbi:MAG: MBL fold metallo-hydrolase [Prevotellaceae bacterium]|nr:MBL fold metallo-hydrolase [Prevotellaceae bacterium]